MKEIKSFCFYSINRSYLSELRLSKSSALFSFWKGENPRPHLVILHPRPEIGLVAVPVSTKVKSKSIKQYPAAYIDVSIHLGAKNSYLCLMNMFPINKENCYSEYINSKRRYIKDEEVSRRIEDRVSITHKYLSKILQRDQKSNYLNYKYLRKNNK